jgi:CheY-like chemotaxis protein
MATILVVEDERDSRELLARTVRKGGHTAVVAANGWEALLALDEAPVDLVLLDLMMPGMDGPTFLSILRNDQRRRSVPVVLVTALSEGDLLTSAARLGVSKCLKKAHYTAEDLLSTIEQVLVTRMMAQDNIRGDIARGALDN